MTNETNTTVKTETKNPVGRPDKRTQSVMKHLQKKYTGKKFSSGDLAKSYGLQFAKHKTDTKQYASVVMNKLARQGVIVQAGKGENSKRGPKPTLYTLA